MLQNGSLRLPSFHCNADPDPIFYFNTDPDPAFHFDADPDPALHFDADPDPAAQNDADPCGSGSATLEPNLHTVQSSVRLEVHVTQCSLISSLHASLNSKLNLQSSVHAAKS